MVDWGPDPGRTRRVWIVTLGLVSIVGMALTVVLAVNPAETADATILAPIVGSAVGALATLAVLHRDDGPPRP